MLHIKISKARSASITGKAADSAVRLRGFSKHFKPRSKKGSLVKAVDGLNLDMVPGSITVLLGANGSGKSTTLNAIAGLETITSGSIEIDGTGGLGFCPQKNVLWDLMTAEEHVSLFERLKRGNSGRMELASEVQRLLTGCDLELKRSAKAGTLSGAQKRKLQLAMMLAGGSRV